jgi:hypothetical protein
MRAVVERWRDGTSPEEIPHDLSHLTLAQVFDALSYYLNHSAEINAHNEANRIPTGSPRPVNDRSIRGCISTKT